MPLSASTCGRNIEPGSVARSNTVSAACSTATSRPVNASRASRTSSTRNGAVAAATRLGPTCGELVAALPATPMRGLARAMVLRDAHLCLRQTHPARSEVWKRLSQA